MITGSICTTMIDGTKNVSIGADLKNVSVRSDGVAHNFSLNGKYNFGSPIWD